MQSIHFKVGYPLDALPAALDHLDRDGFGKIVVEVA
jgi:hypothetical protein